MPRARDLGIRIGDLEPGPLDAILAWSTANAISAGSTQDVTMLANERIDQVFYAAIDATEEAIVNALLSAETTTGRGGATAHRLDPDVLRELLA